jgi:protein-tyrosine phosphatase
MPTDRYLADKFLKLDVAEGVPALHNGMLFRTSWALYGGLPAAATESTVNIDLRHCAEMRADELNLFSEKIIRCPIHQSGTESTLGDSPGRREYASMYCGMIDTCGPAIARAIEFIASSLTTGVVVGCSAGKDRTGIIVALVLSAIGIPAEVVLDAEYRARDRISRAIEWTSDAEWAWHLDREHAVRRMRTAHEAVMDCLEYCADRHGSIAQYLLHINIAESTLAALAELRQPDHRSSM